MKSKTIVALLSGSIVVHAVVTACTSTSGEASAEPAAPNAAVEISPEPCNATYESTVRDPASGGVRTLVIHYSEHAYPGKTKAEIAAHVAHWVTIDDPSAQARPPTYKDGLTLQSAVYARDGFAGAGCEEGKTGFFIWRP